MTGQLDRAAPGTPAAPARDSRPPSRRLGRLRPTSAVDKAAETLRDAVVDGTLRPGERLVEAAVADSMGLSRNTVREVFRMLEAERILDRSPNRGVVVRSLTAADIRDVYVVRRLVEVGAVRRAGAADDELLLRCVAALRTSVATSRAARDRTDPNALAAADLAFHSAITELSGSRRLVETVAGIKAELRLAFAAKPDRVSFHAAYVERNARICELVAAGEYETAAGELESYLDDSEQELLDHLRD